MLVLAIKDGAGFTLDSAAGRVHVRCYTDHVQHRTRVAIDAPRNVAIVRDDAINTAPPAPSSEDVESIGRTSQDAR